MHRTASVLATVALVAAPGAATAAQAVVDLRESVTHVYYQGGFAIVGDRGEDGSLEPLTSLSPTALALDGGNHLEGRYLGWSVEWDSTWALAQDWTLDAAAHAIGGSGTMRLAVSGAVVGPNCAPCLPSMLVDGTNAQALEFALDAATPYRLAGETTPSQWVSLLEWVEVAQRWMPVVNGPTATQGTDFDLSGLLEAGRYRIQNNGSALDADGGQPVRDVAWDWTLTLPGAAVSAVPEPPAALMLAVGALLLSLLRRR